MRRSQRGGAFSSAFAVDMMNLARLSLGRSGHAHPWGELSEDGGVRATQAYSLKYFECDASPARCASLV